MTRDNNKKTHYVVLGGKGGGQAESVDWSDIQNKPEFATVATTGDYDDLNDKPTILTQWFGTQAEYDAILVKDPNTIYNIEGSDNVQADWNQSDSSANDYIKNKPTIPTVPTNVSAFTNDAGYTTFDGDYNSLTNKPTIPAAQVNSDWNASTGVSQILNKPTLATVATTGSYNDLTDKPTIPEAPVQSDWSQTDSTALDYIKNKPTIPAAQVNSDWNANSGVSQILNKPNMSTETLTFTLQDSSTVSIIVYTQPTV